MFEAICAGYKDTPPECSAFLFSEHMIPILNIDDLQAEQDRRSGVKQTTFLKILFVLVIMNVALVLGYRKCL